MNKCPIFITKNNSITPPKELREKHDLQPGDTFDYQVLENGVIQLIRKGWGLYLLSLQPVI
jgi:AbrB family looped-hinge helix DNA binding protein